MKKQPVKIMGILNVTPDSFSDGGKFFSPDLAVEHTLQMIQEGADIIDVGGESTGPESVYVFAEEELRRVLLVIGRLARTRERGAKRRAFCVSIDTYKAEVAYQAILAGARMVNDVTALRGDPEMARVVADGNLPVILMYAKDPTPRTTRTKKHYRDVMQIVKDFLQIRVEYALKAGIKAKNIILDPGMGAFVSAIPKYSFEILHRLGELKKLGFPILVGVSRKSFLPGRLEERLIPTLTANLIAIQNGADIIRVHDVAPHRQMLATMLQSNPL